MSMENRITTLEEVSQFLIAALRRSNDAMRRYHAGAVRRDEAMRQATEAIDRQAESVRRVEESVQQLRATLRLIEEDHRVAAEALDRHDEILQALQAFVPLTQAEVVRLDSRIDQIEGE